MDLKKLKDNKGPYFVSCFFFLLLYNQIVLMDVINYCLSCQLALESPKILVF